MATHSSILPGESHGQRSLVGYSPQSHQEPDTTEATQHTHTHTGCDKAIIRMPQNKCHRASDGKEFKCGEDGQQRLFDDHYHHMSQAGKNRYDFNRYVVSVEAFQAKDKGREVGSVWTIENSSKRLRHQRGQRTGLRRQTGQSTPNLNADIIRRECIGSFY